ncbi:MAG: hypothetical protein AAF211_08735 [Myxococcota bacterium]
MLAHAETLSELAVSTELHLVGTPADADDVRSKRELAASLMSDIRDLGEVDWLRVPHTWTVSFLDRPDGITELVITNDEVWAGWRVHGAAIDDTEVLEALLGDEVEAVLALDW